MCNTKIDVEIDALYRLKDTINQASGQIIDIGKSIDSHLQATLERLQRSVLYFRERLNIAQREVDKAQEAYFKADSALNSCIKSQRRKTDEDGYVYYVPSCTLEAGRAEICRVVLQKAEKIRDVWKQKVDAAERIKGDCEREINRYNQPGGFVAPAGGKYILLNLAQGHTEQASSKLTETINAVKNIQSFSFDTGEITQSSTLDVDNASHHSDNMDDLYESKHEKFETGKRYVEELIDKEESKHNLYEICPYCKKFKYLNCVCGRGQHER